MQNVKIYRQKLDLLKGQKYQIKKEIDEAKSILSNDTKLLHQHQQAKEIIRTVSIMTQQKLQFHIADITSLALDAVFDDPYQLEVEFVLRRNKTECDLSFVRDENKIDNPLQSSGVGSADVAAFALRIASWSMSKPKTNPVMLLDEPFKHLKGREENIRVLKMVKEISEKLNLQIIMISDERIPREDIIEASDRTFEITNFKGKSKVKQLN